ncbi:limonene-1,2-epoxide hydrolase family protein [Pseudonocardia acaciae]|uniref:limonene-1,2-epoxide hydrolase family protein n=1 Tax=Pseudonocardia acaciae TaxID=551276 RepID=UPI0004908DA5|nr:limonene-1,2-epoxide hydrolase family protein [Pseudonocardia acaciae]
MAQSDSSPSTPAKTARPKTSRAKTKKPPEPAPVDVVTEFLAALERLDTDAALALLSDDVVYQNVSLPEARGRDAVGKQLALLNRYATGFRAINHRIVGDGRTVLTERTDIIEIRRVRAAFWVCGRFEVTDGKITEWRDYFDWANVLAGFAAGAGKAVLGLLRRAR